MIKYGKWRNGCKNETFIGPVLLCPRILQVTEKSELALMDMDTSPRVNSVKTKRSTMRCTLARSCCVGVLESTFRWVNMSQRNRSDTFVILFSLPFLVPFYASKITRPYSTSCWLLSLCTLPSSQPLRLRHQLCIASLQRYCI